MEPIEFPDQSALDLFSTENTLKEIEAEVIAFPTSLSDLDNKYQEEMMKIREKFDKQRRALREKHEANIAKLAALKEQAARDELAKVYSKTAKIVKEICADFEAWGFAHKYQVEDVVSIVHAYVTGEGGILNANEMGLGKTYETILALYIIMQLFEKEYDRKPTLLWLTKSSILETDSTKKEIARWWPDFKCVSISGSENKESRALKLQIAHGGGYGVLTNYEIVRTTEIASSVVWDLIVMDEVHKLKGGANPNGPTAIWTAVKNICPQAKFVQMLSGTPLVNRPEEMWSYLHIFDPILFPNAREFVRRFGDVRSLGTSSQIVLNVERLLKQALKGRMIRRTAKEVGQELPDLQRQEIVLPHNAEQSKVYQGMRDRFFVWLDEMAEQKKALTANAIIAQLTRLRQINVLPMFDFTEKDEDGNVIGEYRLDVNDSSKLDECEDIILNAQDQVVVFSTFNEPLRELKRRMDGIGIRCEMITSETSKQMSSYEEEFQQGNITVLCINSAMGEGLNLQKFADRWPGGANHAIMLDRWWNNARDEQCIKRIYRQGASMDMPVFVYDLFCKGSALITS